MPISVKSVYKLTNNKNKIQNKIDNINKSYI